MGVVEAGTGEASAEINPRRVRIRKLQNLFVFSKYSGIEPEVAPKTWGVAYDGSLTPRSKSVTLNINVGF